ncbi:conserved hypothetical protein [Culex quinquefasciatus]|uniref:RRM domain-containing protein n=1 Tax=Culex quinquefasciatus TaxID=7176 RepID=B0X5F1_CULQU|nr:conserved hypothetical protein [Culex quinquefasciatus]|eukprot:XP_001864873.1 conserved hypothetical protein [Culex quinquefasciatus]
MCRKAGTQNSLFYKGYRMYNQLPEGAKNTRNINEFKNLYPRYVRFAYRSASPTLGAGSPCDPHDTRSVPYGDRHARRSELYTVPVRELPVALPPFCSEEHPCRDHNRHRICPPLQPVDAGNQAIRWTCHRSLGSVNKPRSVEAEGEERVRVRIIAGKGFGFVHFADPASVDKAAVKNKIKFNGREIHVERSRPPIQKESSEQESIDRAIASQNLLKKQQAPGGYLNYRRNQTRNQLALELLERVINVQCRRPKSGIKF